MSFTLPRIRQQFTKNNHYGLFTTEALRQNDSDAYFKQSVILYDDYCYLKIT